MVVTELGMITEVNAAQPWKALSGIIETLSPIVKDVSPIQAENTEE